LEPFEGHQEQGLSDRAFWRPFRKLDRRAKVGFGSNEYRRATVNVLDLFSGIGGFSLGLERAGMRTVAFCEIDPFCRAVLAKHWPHVPCYDDVRSLTAEQLRADGIDASAICGGFPCQDISAAGSGRGLDGERSGLWKEYHRLVCELRPRFAIVENVGRLAIRGLARILGDLAESGYDAEWHTLGAAHVGAHHIRERIWILAYPEGERRLGGWGPWSAAPLLETRGLVPQHDWPRPDASDTARAPNGLPDRLDRIRALGNAVVPQIPEIIGRAIMRSAFEPPE
jgi:DNA (cytosine-5)-methyltransferase 1